MNGLQMVRQAIVGPAKIKSLVFSACPEVPVASDREATRVTNVIIERVAVAKIVVGVVVIAAERVVHFIIEQIEVVALLWRRGRLHLVRRCAKEKNGQKFSDVSHGVVKAFVD